MQTLADFQPALDLIQSKTNIKPVIGIVLGSGLAPLADDIEEAVHIPYNEIPGLPTTTVHGHSSELVIGKLGGVAVACLKGRIHFYEGTNGSDFKALIRLVKLIGCNSILITNSSGSLRKEVPPGDLVLINDHINFQFRNPLIGPNDDEFGPRFFAMDDVYDKDLRHKFHATAKQLDIATHEGVYMSVLGPNFETPAEIRAFRTLGADVIGMSTVPDVLVAKHCG
jgi:xanthosine phosphorylase